MTSQEILEKYINFYTVRGHRVISNVSLVPENDPTLLYVNSGMFPLVPYLSGESHPMGKRLVNVQRALRFFEDLENIGITNRHTTAFHMIGNWSLGDYFKDEQLPWAYEFLIELLGLDPHRMFATVFEGDEFAPKDTESIEIIKEIFAKYGIEAKESERIFAYGREDNWWQRGNAVGELGGPDSEVFYYIGSEGTGLGRSPSEYQDEFIELGNSVFMQYFRTETGWAELSQKNVDFGGGLERIAMVVQGKSDIYQTDNFWPIIQKIRDISGKEYGTDGKTTKAMRVIADHMRASVFLAMDGVVPSNKDQGYILRRLLRRMVRAGRGLGMEKNISVSLVRVVVDSFTWLYPFLQEKCEDIEKIFSDEEIKFSKTLQAGSGELLKLVDYIRSESPSAPDVSKEAFRLYQSFGFPFEIFVEYMKDFGLLEEKNIKELEEEFNKLLMSHQEQSRKGAEQKFKGGLADHSDTVVKYHTATHLLHFALREELGEDVYQQGSNITGERLRFDFNYKDKLTEEQIGKVEEIMNSFVDQNLPVKFEVMNREDAEGTGALHFFGEKYGDSVKVYYIGESLNEAISKEFCGGPHVERTGHISKLEIYKQENIGKGKMRIYARFV